MRKLKFIQFSRNNRERMRRNFFVFVLALSVFFLFGNNNQLFAQTENEITAFVMSQQTGPATIGTGTISIEVIYGTDITGGDIV